MHARSTDFSKTTITELMIPSYANFGGKIHGGILLSLIDKAAYACASRHSGAYCVTVSIDVVDFLAPVEVGELVSLKASVNYTGNSSMVIGIKVIAENVKTGLVKHTNTSYVTMVAKDDNGDLQKVPPLRLENETDIRRYAEAVRRKELKAGFRSKMQNIKESFDLNQELNLIEGHRCEIEIKKG